MKWMLQFDWDFDNITHIAAHDVEPHEAEEVLNGFTIDLGHRNVNGEERFREAGLTAKARFLEVVTTWRSDRIRVVSAFDASKKAVEEYLRQR